ncbi:MAG: PAS domain-containing sensor histidine kinase, partial [Chloroflexota bacterium]
FLLLPVLVSGWCFGLPVGLGVGLVLLVLNGLMLSLFTSRSWEDVLHYDIPAYLAMLLANVIVARLHDMGERLKQALNRQTQLEMALRESETRFRTFFEQSPFSTQIFRPDGSVITLNPAFGKLWNANAIESQYVIENYNILQDEQLEKSGLLQFIKQGFTDRFTEIPAIEYNPQKTEMVKDTHLTTQWVLGHIWPLKDEHERVQQVVLMHQDITVRKQVETQQMELALTQERADLLKELLNTLSHDLKTPLSILSTSLYLLEKKSDPEYQKSKIETSKEQVNRLSQIIQSILTTSYLETATVFSIKAVNLNVIADQVREELSSVAENGAITFERLFESTLPPARANEIELRRVLMNLIENALHYTPTKGRVTLRTFTKDAGVVIEVSDTGIGIEAEDLPHIFDDFYRADKARTTNHGGTGLGLAIARKIVERHLGKIEVESTPGQGSSFRVWLPKFEEEIVK